MITNYSKFCQIISQLTEIGGGEIESDFDSEEYAIRIMCSDYQIWANVKKLTIEIELPRNNIYVTVRVDEDNYLEAANFLKNDI